MDMVYKNLPYSQVKAEDSSDCIIDLEAEPTTSNSIQTWYSDITQKIHKSTHYGNEKYVDDMMVMYYRSLKEKIVDAKDKPKLKDQILTHIKYFYLYYKEIEHSLVDTNYFIRMEDILTCYCDLELEVVHNLSKQRETKKYFMLVIKRFCKVVGIYLYHNLKHILHVLLKMKYNVRNPACQMVMRKIYFHFLMSLPVEPHSDEVFCRYYLGFERYKEVAKPEEKKAISDLIFFKFGKTRDYITTNSLMKKILTPSGDSVTNIVAHLLDSRTTMIETYFDHLKNNEIEKRNRLNTNIDSQCGSSDFLKTYNDVLCTFSEATIDIDSNTDSTNKDSDSDIEVLEEEGTIVVSDAEDIDEIVYREKDVRNRHRTKKKKFTAPQSVADVISLDSDDDLSFTQDNPSSVCTVTDRLSHSPAPSTPLLSASEHGVTLTSSLSSLSSPTVSTVLDLDVESLNLPTTSSSALNKDKVPEKLPELPTPSLEKETSFAGAKDQVPHSLPACQTFSNSEIIRHKEQSEISKLFATPATELPKFDLRQANVLEAKTSSDLSVTVQKGCTPQECGINFSSPSFLKRQLPPPKIPVLFNAAPTRYRSPQRINRVSDDITDVLDNASLKITELKLNEDNASLKMTQLKLNEASNQCSKREISSNPFFNLFPYTKSKLSTQEQATQQSSVLAPSSNMSSVRVSMSQETSSTLSQQIDSQTASDDEKILSDSISAQISICTSVLPDTLDKSKDLQLAPIFSASSTDSSIKNVCEISTAIVNETSVNKESRFSETPPEKATVEDEIINTSLVSTMLPSLPQQVNVVPLHVKTSLLVHLTSSVEVNKVVENHLIYTSPSEITATKSRINKVSAKVPDLEEQLAVSSKSLRDAEALSSSMVSPAANTLLVQTLPLTPIMSSQLVIDSPSALSTTKYSITNEKREFLLPNEFPKNCLMLTSLASSSSSLLQTQHQTQLPTLAIVLETQPSETSTVTSLETASTQHMPLTSTVAFSGNVESQRTKVVPITSTEPLLVSTTSSEDVLVQRSQSPNETSIIEEQVIKDQSKDVTIIVSSVDDTSSINTLTSSVPSLIKPFSENTYNKQQKPKNIEKEEFLTQKVPIYTSDISSNSSMPSCISQVRNSEALQYFKEGDYNISSIINEETKSALPPVTADSTKIQMECSTSISDMSPSNYRIDIHDSDTDIFGYNYCENKQECNVNPVKSSSESVSYKFGMVTPPTDPRSDKNLIDLEDSEYENIYGAERQTESRQNFVHADCNLGDSFNSCREKDHSKVVDTDMVGKNSHSDNFSVKDIIIERVESVRNDDLNISFSDGEQNENIKANTASEQYDEFADTGQICGKNYYLGSDDLNACPIDDGDRSRTPVDIEETVVIKEIPLNVSPASYNKLLRKATTSFNNGVFGEHGKMEEDGGANRYEGSISSPESMSRRFEKAYKRMRTNSMLRKANSEISRNEEIVNCTVSKLKTKSKSKYTRSKDLNNEIKRKSTYNGENSKHKPNGDILFNNIEYKCSTKYNNAYQENVNLHSTYPHSDSHSDHENMSPTNVDIEETVVVQIAPPEVSPTSYKKMLREATDSYSCDFDDQDKINLEQLDELDDGDCEEIEYEGNTSSTESVDPQFDSNFRLRDSFNDAPTKFSRNDRVTNHRISKYKAKSKSKSVRFKDLSNNEERIDGHNSDSNNSQRVLYRSEGLQDGYHTFNLADTNIELERILTGPIGDMKETNNSQYYENSDEKFNLFGFANSIFPMLGEVSKDLMIADKTKDIDSPAYDEMDSKDIRDYMKNEFKYNAAFAPEEHLNNPSVSGASFPSKCSVSFNDVVETRCITPVYINNKSTKTHKKKFVIRDRVKCFIDPRDERLNMVTKVVLNKLSDDVLLKTFKVTHHNTLRTCICKKVDWSSDPNLNSTEKSDALSKGSSSYDDLHENMKEAAMKGQRTVANGQSSTRRRRGRPRKTQNEEDEQPHPRKRRKKVQTNKVNNYFNLRTM